MLFAREIPDRARLVSDMTLAPNTSSRGRCPYL